jgi:hypothetical protein
MRHHTKIFTLVILPSLLLAATLPAAAQNRGARGVPMAAPAAATGVRHAPRPAAPAPRATAPSAPARSYSAPRSTPSRSVSTPRSNSSYRAPSNTNSNYRAPLTRQAVPAPSNRASNTNYRPNNTTYRASQPSLPTFNTGAATGVMPRSNNRQVRSYSPPVNAQGTALPIRSTTARVVNTANSQGFNPVTGAATGVRHGIRGVNPNPSRGTSAIPVMYTNPVTTQQVTNNYYINNSSRRYTPRYANCYDPYFYSNYNYRRGYRYYDPCYSPFLSLGFFVARPYTYYDYARIDYARPFVYGEDADYRSAPIQDNNQVASTQPATPPSMEQELLGQLGSYVAERTVDGRFQIPDPAFGGQLWKLDLTQAPAVYSIDSNHYSVVAGFEGTLGDATIPSSVGLEFFVARENGKWAIKDAWIVSANGIPRAKKFQSPLFPQVQTWQEGELCPFSGLPMVPLADTATPSRG